MLLCEIDDTPIIKNDNPNQNKSNTHKQQRILNQFEHKNKPGHIYQKKDHNKKVFLTIFGTKVKHFNFKVRARSCPRGPCQHTSLKNDRCVSTRCGRT